MPQVVVVGAGVIGLSCALTLSEAGHKVKVIAAHFPTDPLNSRYTSPWAGAHYRPFPSHTEKDHEDAMLTRVTYDYFKKVAVEEPGSSVKWIEGIDLLEKKGIYGLSAKGYYEDIDLLKELPRDQLPNGVEFGASYKTWVLNSPLYIQHLMRKLTFEHGVTFTRAEIISLKQVAQAYPGHVVVNASGTGLQWEGGYDPDSFEIRGQTLLVRAPKGCSYFDRTITHQSDDGLWTFVIPRPLHGGIILGGTKQLNDYQSTPKEEDTKALIKRARTLFPELFIDGELDIRNINVGFRPARKGGMRVDVEKFAGTTVINAYGAGGMGYELSYGVGKKVEQLVAGLPTKSML